MEQAAAKWEGMLVESVEIYIDVREASILELPFGAVALADVNWYRERPTIIRDALTTDAISADDQNAVSHLALGPRVTFQTWDAEQNVIVNNGDDLINNWIGMSRAQLFALDIPLDAPDPNPDATISWSPFTLDKQGDFDRSDGVDGFDFVGVAMHEIGHVLGFVSGVDDIDVIHAGIVPGVTPDEINEYAVVSILDLFRFSAESLPLPDLTPGSAAYFSIDGGATSLAEFGTGEFFGNGWQAGHWQNGQGGVMEAYLFEDRIHHLTRLDVRAMDVIGWDVSPAFFGDFDGDGTLTSADINALSAAVRAGDHPSSFDLNLDQRVDDADRTIWVTELKRTYSGDGNLDGEFPRRPTGSGPCGSACGGSSSHPHRYGRDA
jgi:hypothetical protein